MQTETPQKRKCVYIPLELHTDLKTHSSATRQKTKDVVDKALSEYLAKPDVAATFPSRRKLPA